MDVISLIPTRFGNGSLEAVARENLFSPPKLTSLQVAAEYGVALKRGRVFADLWDLQKLSTCLACFEKRFQKLQLMNLHQQIPSSVNCEECGRKNLKAEYDFAIAGSGFSGSLMAMVLRQLGFSVIILERGKHPDLQ